MTLNPTDLARRVVWTLLLLESLCATSFPLQRDLKMEPFTHTTWGPNEGAPQRIFAITQTPDGYLWIGSAEGLFRFDGLTFERYQPPLGPPLPGERVGVQSLLALPNGDLWIGFAQGAISLLRNGHAVNYGKQDGVPSGVISSLAQDQAGTIWAGSANGLIRLENNRWKEVGSEWNFPGPVARAIYLDRAGTLWVATKDSIVFLPKGAGTFQSTGIHVGVVPQIVEAPNGKLWMAEASRSVRPVPLHTTLAPSDETEVRVGSQRILFSREGDLWIPTLGDGLFRVPAPEKLTAKPDRSSRSVERYSVEKGLSDDFGLSAFQDRDGNIWVGTERGLDRYRKSLWLIGSPTDFHDADLIEGDHGDIWVIASNGDVGIHNSRIYKDLNPLVPPRVMYGYREPSGKIWWICLDGIVEYEHGHFLRYPLAKGIQIRAPEINVTVDRSGTLWIYLGREGLYSWRNGTWNRFDTPSEFAEFLPTAAFTDDLGRIWFGGTGGTVFYLSDGRIHIVANSDKSPPGAVRAIQGRNGHVWVGGLAGLTYFDGSQLRSVAPTGGDSFQAVSGIEETADGNLWILEHRGVIHIDAAEVRKFLAMPTYHVSYEVLDSDDGLPGRISDRIGQNVIQDRDGRLWFVPTNGLASLDPIGLSRNPPAPVASVQSIVADGQSYLPWMASKLPAGIRSLQIRYTAVSLTYAPRTHFRYKLDGFDTAWQDVGVQRTAYYTNLHPGKYQFRVLAVSNHGVGDPDGAAVEFTIPPFWFQEIWFQVLFLAAFLGLLWGIYRFHLQQLRKEFNVRLEARLNERERIARDLHDTFFQGIQGLLLRFHTATSQLPKDEPARRIFEDALIKSDQVMLEGRELVLDLRATISQPGDLPTAFSDFGDELRKGGSCDFKVVVNGTIRPLHAVVFDELFKIGKEALGNAFRHSGAHSIEVELDYGRSELCIRIRDDGAGIDSGILRQGHREGHFGMPGMRERAEKVGAHLDVWSRDGAGTEIELRIAGAVAYVSEPNGSRLWKLSRLWHGKNAGRPRENGKPV